MIIDLVHPYAIDRMVQERQEELRRLRRADCCARSARRAPIPHWRRGAVRALVGLAVAVSVPRSRRRTALGEVTAILGLGPTR